ncbi:MAG: hypothetical protein IKT14_05280 [Clostridiales bacterium]|nr:hypothetical protein [Clostridiales bacterium]
MADTIQCPNCSANLVFDADTQKLVCDFCGASFLPDELTFIPEETKDHPEETKKEEQKAEEVPEVSSEETSSKETSPEVSADEYSQFVCNACGAAVITDKTTSASFCAFCGSPALIGQRLTNEFRPRYMIPFAYGREKAVEKFYGWCKGGRFTPISFVSDRNIEKLTGLYVPFWLFDIDGKMDYSGTGVDVNVVTTGSKTVTTTKYYDVKRKGTLHWRKIPLDAETKIDDKLMEAIEPFNYKGLRDYDFKYIPGFFADTYDLKAEDLNQRIVNRAMGYMNEEFKSSTKEYDRVTGVNNSSSFSEPKAELALLPVWFLSYKYLGKTYHFAMNGQSGEVAGVPPVSMVKRTILFAVLLAVLTVITKIIVGLMLGGYVG